MKTLNFKRSKVDGFATLVHSQVHSHVPEIIRIINIPDAETVAQVQLLVNQTTILRQPYVIEFNELGIGNIIK